MSSLNYDLFAMRVSDGSIRRLTASESAEYAPRWSPDGKTIAYLGTKRGLTSVDCPMEDEHVWLMNADGSNRHELVSHCQPSGPSAVVTGWASALLHGRRTR